MPVVKNNVTYIVMAVLFNEDGEVLMMQEAKSSCAGQWYLPAGRMEPGEDIQVVFESLINIKLVLRIAVMIVNNAKSIT